MSQRIPYVYKWTHIPTLAWYVGSRTGKGCHPDDGYICSSENAKPIILSDANNWQKTIIATGTVEEMLSLEQEILTSTKAWADHRSLNGGIGHPTNVGKPPKNSSVVKRKETIANSNDVTCPVCNKTGKLANMVSNHFDNCGRQKGKKATNKGVSPPKHTCFVCGKTVSYGNLMRWHNDNCSKDRPPPVNKGIKEEIVVCPHCGKSGGKTGMRSSHFEYCKLNPGTNYVRPDKRRKQHVC